MKKLKQFKLLQDLFALSGGQLLSQVVGFVAFAYLARTLDPASYGTVEYVVGLTVVFSMVVDWGLGPIGVREVGGDPDTATRFAAVIPTARLGLAIVVVPIMGLSTIVTGHEGVAADLAWLYAIGLFAIAWKQDWLLQGLEMMKAVAPAQFIRMAVFASGVVLFVGSPDDLLNIGFVELAAVASFATYFLIIQKVRVAPIRLKFAWPEIGRLMGHGASVGLTNMLWALTQYAPLFVLSTMVGGNETGWFGASNRIVGALLSFSWIYHFNLYPTMVRRAGGSPEHMNDLIRASFRIVAWGGIFLALIVTVLAEPLLVLVFGAKFSSAAIPLAVLIWTVPITLLSGHARWALVATGRQKDLLAAAIAGVSSAAIAGLILVPNFQAVGAAAAMVVASLIVWGFAQRFALRGPSRPPVMLAGVPVLVALVSGYLAQFIDASPWLAGAAAAAAFLFGGLALDRKILPDFLRLINAKADYSLHSS